MNLRIHLLAFGLLFSSTAATAQEACPGGTQVGQNCGGGYCVPICAYDESPQKAPEPSPRVVERWEVIDDRFGAWAVEPSTGALAASYGESSAEVAERKAIAACHQKGGKDCVSPGAFHNVCSTAAWGGTCR